MAFQRNGGRRLAGWQHSQGLTLSATQLPGSWLHDEARVKARQISGNESMLASLPQSAAVLGSMEWLLSGTN